MSGAPARRLWWVQQSGVRIVRGGRGAETVAGLAVPMNYRKEGRVSDADFAQLQ